MHKLSTSARYLLGVAVLALVGAGFAISQQFVPPTPTSTLPAVVGTVVNALVAAVNPTPGAVCGTYNVSYQNWVTGEEFICINAGLLPATRQLFTGAASADSAVLVTLSGGAATYNLVGTYLTAPVCLATDTTAAAAVKASATTTVVTLAGTTTDVIALSCAKRT